MAQKSLFTRHVKIRFSDDLIMLSMMTLLLQHDSTKYIDGHPKETPPLGCAGEIGLLSLPGYF